MSRPDDPEAEALVKLGWEPEIGEEVWALDRAASPPVWTRGRVSQRISHHEGSIFWVESLRIWRRPKDLRPIVEGSER